MSRRKKPAAEGEEPIVPPGEDPRVTEAVLGRMVDDFLSNDPIGKYIIEQAKLESGEAQGLLLEADATDAMAIKELQFKGRLPTLVVGWLGNAIQNGKAQEQALQQERDEGQGFNAEE